MPAKRNLPREDQAVSPIIGVILMVAITVVIAGTVFFIAKGFGTGTERPPNIQFLRDDTNGQLTVIRADNSIDRKDFEVTMAVGGHFGYNEPATAATYRLDAGAWAPFAPVTGTEIRGGDTIDFCGDVQSHDVEVKVRSVNPSGLLYTYKFTDFPPCL